MAPTSSKQHGVNVSVNASATPFQQPSGYGSHGYNTGKLTLTPAVSGVCEMFLNEFQGVRLLLEKVALVRVCCCSMYDC